MFSAAALALGVALAQPAPPVESAATWVMPASTSATDGDYGVAFVARYRSLGEVSATRAADLDALATALHRGELDRTPATARLQRRRAAVQHWLAVHGRAAEDADRDLSARLAYLTQVELLRAEDATLALQLELLAEGRAAADVANVFAPPPPTPPPVADAPAPPTRTRKRQDAFSFGGQVEVGPDEIVRDAVSFGGDIDVHGTVEDTVASFGGTVHLFPTAIVHGDAVAFGGDLVVDPGATLHGEPVAFGGDIDGVGAAALARHDVVFDADDEVPSDHGATIRTGPSTWQAAVSWLVPFLAFAGAGVLTLGLAPGRVGRVAAMVDDRPVAALATGAFGTFALMVGTALFAITLVGIPVSMLLLALLAAAWLLGFVGLCQAVGDRLPFDTPVHGRWVAFVVGALLVTAASALPWVGQLVVVAGSLLGIGAALATRMGASPTLP